MHTTQDAQRPAIERLDAVRRRTGLARSTIYRMLAAGADFPRPVKLGDRAIGFVAAEIDAWIAARAAERDGAAAK